LEKNLNNRIQINKAAFFFSIFVHPKIKIKMSLQKEVMEEIKAAMKSKDKVL